MNKKIYALLKDKTEMRKKGFFIADTENILFEAVSFKCGAEYFLYSKKGTAIYQKYKGRFNGAEQVRENYIEKYSNIKNGRGFIAVMKAPDNTLKNLKKMDLPVLLDNIQDPGNIGAIIRSGAAFGFKDYLLLNCCYIFNEKAIRASAGAVFIIRHREVAINDIIKLRKSYGLAAADAAEGREIDKIKGKKNIIIAFGNEGRGLSAEIKEAADYRINIKHKEKNIESLNVAASAAIIFYVISGRQPL